MFIGHLAAGFAAKRFAPRAGLGVLMAGGAALDILYFVFLLAGLEQMRIEPGNTVYSPLAFDHYPFSHSLLATAVWSLLVAALYFGFTRYRAGAVAIGCASLSHWFLDAIVHRPDMPLYPGHASPIGLGLWNSLSATFLVEGAIFLASLAAYLTMGHARDRIGKYALYGFVTFVLLLYVGTPLSPPPPSTGVVAVSGLVLTAMLMLWATWFDRHRISRAGSGA